MDLILNFINTQNIFVIFLIALVEGGLILGQYSPGGIVIFLSIMSTEGNMPKMILLLSVITIAYLLAYSLDYLFGYYGVEIVIKKLGFEKKVERYRKLLDKNVFSTIFFSYAETNIASLVAVSSGLLKISFRKFISFSIVSVIFWNAFWAVVLYFFGNAILSIFGATYLVVILAIWVLIVFYNNFLKKEETEIVPIA
jgi:membrane protein DedA with SNARE-associated domain